MFSHYGSAAHKYMETEFSNGIKARHVLFIGAIGSRLDKEISELLELQDKVISRLNDILRKMDNIQSV